MADFGEYLPFDCVLHDGNPEELHNLWPVIWAKINRDALREANAESDVMFFTRSGYNGAEEFTSIMWNGDQHTDYSPDYGMQSVLPASFNLGFSGLTLVHSDIGGYISFKNMARDTELFVRWMEMNTFSPLMRSHETVRPDINAQPDSKDVLAHTVKLTNLHAKLTPYIKDVLEKARGGIPAIAPDFYYESDYLKSRDLHAYYFGEDIFISPVTASGVSKKTVYLPKGDWVHFFTKKEYAEGEHIIKTPLGEPAAFYRKGSAFEEVFKNV